MPILGIVQLTIADRLTQYSPNPVMLASEADYVKHIGTRPRLAHIRASVASVRATPAVISEPVPSPAYRLLFRRALGNGEQPSTTTSSSSGLSASDTLFPSPSPSPNPGGKQGISQTVLEWIFVVIALGLLAILVIWRCTCLRYRNRNRNSQLTALSSVRAQGGRASQRPRSYAHVPQNLQPAHIRDSADSTTGSPFGRQTRNLVLSPSFLHTGLMPLVDGRGVLINTPSVAPPRVRGQRVRGLDVGEGGRRGGGSGGGDENGDELPAYEVGKEPPGYQAAIGPTASPGIVQVGLPERIADQYLQHSEESQSIDQSSPREVPENASGSLDLSTLNREPGISPPPSPSPDPASRGQSPLHPRDL
ncbi:hypothetical protein JB92DRAFT_3175870 [Gautieria morchelliformis]|nr:hypothetical protein JB92DRAFT_3175870 [Gautieria morchelliformis]